MTNSKDHGTAQEGHGKEPRWRRRWLQLLKPTLKAADVILGSLAKINIPLESMKEYKEAIEAGAELGNATADAIEPPEK